MIPSTPVRPKASQDLSCNGPALRLLRLVVQAPGATPNQLAQESGFRRRRSEKALRILASGKHVLVFIRGRTRHVFPARPGLGFCWDQVLALRDEEKARLYRRLLCSGPANRADILMDAETRWGWSGRTAAERLSHLRRCGLVKRVPADDLRRMRLHALPPHPVARDLLPALWQGNPEAPAEHEEPTRPLARMGAEPESTIAR